MEPDKAESHVTPEPEGPEQIAERMQRRREGFSGRIMRALWRMTGLEHLSPARKALVFAVGTVGLGLLGFGIFTELPYSWLITIVLIILPLVFHGEKEEEDSETDANTDADTDSGSDTNTHREV